jgi:hypothetical protein
MAFRTRYPLAASTNTNSVRSFRRRFFISTSTIFQMRSISLSLRSNVVSLVEANDPKPVRRGSYKKTLDFLAPRINYKSCHDVVQLYSVRHSGDMARIRDTAPAICRGFVIFEGRHAKSPKGERRLALVTPAAQAAQHAS